MLHINKIKALLLTIMSLIMFSSTAYAQDSTSNNGNILTLGESVTLEQKQLILDYLGIDELNTNIIIVKNEDEHKYLEDIISSDKIGTRTYSCAYIEPTVDSGINIKTVNLNYITSDMIKNALVTSGITSCNIICISPIEVSGTGSLTGIFMAYEKIHGEKLDDAKMDLASEELITTATLSEYIGKDTASTLLNDLKQKIIENKIIDQEKIANEIEEYINNHKINLTEDQKWELAGLLLKIANQDYDINKIKEAYKDMKETITNIKETGEKALNIFQKTWNFVGNGIRKLTGTYEEFKVSEEADIIKQKLGIIAQTNDELLSNNTVITDTNTDETNNLIEQQEDKENINWFKRITNLFRPFEKDDKIEIHMDNIEIDNNTNENSENNPDNLGENTPVSLSDLVE